ncbi:MAG: GreA/GreB family elongation factor [Acidobacteriota bacterium]
MAVSRDTRGQIEKGNFDALEDDWLARIDQDATDLDYFVGTARALVGSGEQDRARTLLGVLDEQLQERKFWGLRLALLELAGPLLAGDDLHAAILETLRQIYSGRQALEGMIETVNLHLAPKDLKKVWEKVDRLRSLMQFERGSVVLMDGKGAGRIVDTNFALKAFKVDFDRISGMNVGFRAAAKLLTPLPEGHILRRKLEDPEGLKKAAQGDPSEVLRALLESYDRPLKAGDIKSALHGVVTSSKWTSWWAAARKHPQVLAGPKQTYTWAESSGDAVESVWIAFRKAPVRQRMSMLRRDGSRDEDLRAQMGAELAKTAVESLVTEPGLAFEIWYALQRAGLPTEDLPWSPAALIGETSNLKKLFGGIEDRSLREEAYRLVFEERDDHLGVFLDRIAHEPDTRAVEVLARSLQGSKGFERFLDATLTQPHRAPGAFVWFAEGASEDESLRQRNPLRLLQQILVYLGRDELAPYRLRLKKLFESGNTVPRLLSALTAEQASAAVDAIDRAGMLETYEREELITALELRFPELRGDGEVSDILYATEESISAKRAEFENLVSVEIPANRKAIEEARALGDLRENFEYKSARQRHEYLSSLIASLNHDLSRVQPIRFEQIDPSQVRVGTRVRLTGGAKDTVLTILGPWESDPDNGIVSYESELAAGLLGKAPGETAEVAGQSLTVEAIELARS